MDKLRECPLCEAEVAEITNCVEVEGCANFEKCDNCGWVCVVCNVNNGGCGASGGYADSEEKAIEKWNRRPEPANEPLTLEQLRERNGKPVWIVEHPKWGHWELSEYAEDYLEDRDEDFYGMTMPPTIPDPMGKYGLHMLGWLAYDHEPKEE